MTHGLRGNRIFTLTGFRNTKAEREFDTIIAGGGAAGVGAAVGASLAGAKTLLVESGGSLGGAASLRGVITYCGIYTFEDPPRQVVHGVMREVLERLASRSAVTGPHRHRGVFLVFDPEANKRVLDEVCLDAGVNLSFHSRAIRAHKEGNRLAGIVLETAGEFSEVTANSFVDATGEATLAHLAGASTRYGNAGNQLNLGSLATRFGGISAEASVTADDIAAAVAESRGRGIGPFSKDKSVVCRLPYSADLVIYVASHDYDPRDRSSITEAELAGRRQAEAYLEAVRTIPGCERAYLVSTGPEFGTRESRHLNCVYQLTWRDVMNKRGFEDCIALGAWGAEWHERETFGSVMEAAPGNGFYQIPLDCLRSVDTCNLLAAGRTADGDRKAGAAIRVLGTAIATGQAAGVAAAQIADSGGISVPDLQRELFEQGQTATPEQLAEMRVKPPWEPAPREFAKAKIRGILFGGRD